MFSAASWVEKSRNAYPAGKFEEGFRINLTLIRSLVSANNEATKASSQFGWIAPIHRVLLSPGT
jgi:hypothetical protein